jgi:ATP-dependent DNA helicase DinG
MEGSKPSWLQSNVTEIAVKAQERRAQRLMLQGNLDGAMAVYLEILVLDPDSANAHYQLGLCYRQRRQWEQAVASLEQALALGDTRARRLLSEMAPGTTQSRSSVRVVPPEPAAPPDLSGGDETGPAVVVGGRVLAVNALWPGTTFAPAAPQAAAQPAPKGAGCGTLEAGPLAAGRPDFSSGYRLRQVSEDAPAEEELAARPIICPPLDDVFSAQGPLARILGDQYRPRAGQVRMASLIRDALQNCRHAVIEAGTGIGKSFAYLVPVLWAGAPAVVSTSNKGLMNQLWEKDIPRLKEVAPRPVKAALLKGRGNYVCLLRLEKLRQQVGHPGREQALALVSAGLAQVPLADMELMRLPTEVALRLTASSHECQGRHCAHFESCYYEKAKREAVGADVVVTNHALLCYNALLADNHILPVRPVLIIDEAHQLPRYAIDALTLVLGQDQFRGLLNSPVVREAEADPDLLAELRSGYNDFLRAVDKQRPGPTSSPYRPTRWAIEGEVQAGMALWDMLGRLQSTLSRARNLEEGDREAVMLQAVEMAETARALSTPEPETHIRLCEAGDERTTAATESYHALYRPLEVADPLCRMLFDTWPRVICTSATLSVANDLGWFRRQVGLMGANGDGRVIAEALRGPFDYSRQMLLYTPRALVPVYDEQQQAFTGDYVSQLTAEIRRLLEASRGRALVLCTSRARMNQLYDTLAMEFHGRYPCYMQGDYSQPELVARFRQDGNAILFATRGFWEGLDIPGDALALVILDKVPFVPYDDPIIHRQEARIRERGGNPFHEIQLGSAILSLRQGAGRLIRSETDRGVIALLDARVLTKAYGRQIIQSLPEGCHTTDFGDVAAFLK